MPPETTGFGQQADRRPGLHPPPPPSWCGEPRDAIRRDGSAPSGAVTACGGGAARVRRGPAGAHTTRRPANPPLPEEHARRRGGHGILATHQRTDLRIAAASPTVTRLFDVVGAVTFLHIHPTVEAAHAPDRPEELGLSEDALDRVSGRGDRSG